MEETIGTSLLAVGTFWFWTVVIVECLILVASVEFDSWGWATWSFIGSLAVLDYCGSVPVWDTIRNDPAFCLAFLGAYIGCGIVWAVIKWWFFVKAQKRCFDAFKAGLIKQYGDEWKQYVKDNYYRNDVTDYFKLDREKINIVAKRPIATECKDKIYMWLVFWPWSCLWTLINDPVKRLFQAVYEWISDLLDRISKNIYDGAED